MLKSILTCFGRSNTNDIIKYTNNNTLGKNSDNNIINKDNKSNVESNGRNAIDIDTQTSSRLCLYYNTLKLDRRNANDYYFGLFRDIDPEVDKNSETYTFFIKESLNVTNTLFVEHDCGKYINIDKESLIKYSNDKDTLKVPSIMKQYGLRDLNEDPTKSITVDFCNFYVFDDGTIGLQVINRGKASDRIIERYNCTNKYAIPGGFFDPSEDIENDKPSFRLTAIREHKEEVDLFKETGEIIKAKSQVFKNGEKVLFVMSKMDPLRDQRWKLSKLYKLTETHVYCSLYILNNVAYDDVISQGKDDAQTTKINLIKCEEYDNKQLKLSFDGDTLTEKNFAFDHYYLIHEAYFKMKSQLYHF